MSLLPRRGPALLLGAAFLGACGASDRKAVPAPAAAQSEKTPRAPSVGDAPPAISLRAIDGSPLTLTRGKVTLLVFWATWSEPDKRELIKLQELYTRFGPPTLGVIALSIDDEPSLLGEFAKTYGLRFPLGWDARHHFATTFQVATDPTTYVIDRSGIIRFIHRGYHDGEAEVIASEVESLLR